MSKLFLFLLYFSFFTVSSQVICIPSNNQAIDMVYDVITDRLYITIPSTDAQNGNSIGVLNPYTNILESTLFVGNNPTEMAISDNGQYIYVCFDGIPKVRRYTLNPLAFDAEFGLGIDSSPSNRDYYARDIAVMPGQPTSFAVARKIVDNVTPDHAGVGIYDNGIMRTVDFTEFIYITKIKFKDNNTLIGHAGTSIPSSTPIFTINSSGLTLASTNNDMPNPHPYTHTSDFIYRQNKLYFMNGKRIDISAIAIQDGQYTTLFGGGAVVYDELNNLVCFGDSTNSFSFFEGGMYDGYMKRYDPTTFQMMDTFRITTGGEIDKMISCGDDCYALLTNTRSTGNSRMTIVRPPSLNRDKYSFSNNLILYPNPTTGTVYIENKNDVGIKNIEVYDTLGNIVLTNFSYNKIDLNSFANGVYFCKITDIEGNFITKKIIKQ